MSDAKERIERAYAEIKELMARCDIKIIWAHEPGETARKRREDEEKLWKNHI